MGENSEVTPGAQMMMPSLLQSAKIQLQNFLVTFISFKRAQWVGEKSYKNHN